MTFFSLCKHYVSLYLKGLRPRTWSASLIPFFMSSAFAFKKTELFDGVIFVLTGLSILMIQITVDFFNDALDGKADLDKGRTHRLVGSGRASFTEVQTMAYCSAFLAVLFALPLIWKGGVIVALAGGISLLSCYFYTGSSYSFLKLGLSELAALLFFGFFIVFGTYYLQTLSFSQELIYLSLQCGFWTILILLINHIRDEKEDRLQGRKHFVTLYGRENSLFFIAVLQAGTYFLCFYWINLSPLAGVFSLLICPLSAVLFYQLSQRPVEKYNPLLTFASFTYMIFAGAWILGLFY